MLFAVLLFVMPVYAQQAPYRLIGTIEGKGFMGAVIDDASGSQTLYRLRERLPDGSQIVKIETDHISIRRSDGTSYNLFVVQGGKPAAGAARPAVSPAVPSAGASSLPSVQPYIPQPAPQVEPQQPVRAETWTPPGRGSVVEGGENGKRRYGRSRRRPRSSLPEED
jgi:hypothetical protein